MQPAAPPGTPFSVPSPFRPVTRPAQANDAAANAATLSPESTVLFSDQLFDVVAPRVVPVRAVAEPAMVVFPLPPPPLPPIPAPAAAPVPASPAVPAPAPAPDARAVPAPAPPPDAPAVPAPAPPPPVAGPAPPPAAAPAPKPVPKAKPAPKPRAKPKREARRNRSDDAAEGESPDSDEEAARRGGNRVPRRSLWDPVPGETEYSGPQWLRCKGDCDRVACLDKVTIRSFPESALTTEGYCMYFVWLVRHFHPPGVASPHPYDCEDKDKDCVGARATFQLNRRKTIVRCYRPCLRVKRLTKISPFFKHCGSTSLPRIMAYVFCFMSGASVRFSRHLAGIHHNAAVTRLNTAMSAMCVAENFRQFVEKDKDNWAEIQADESAAGKRKYHRGRRVRQGGIVWMAGAAKIHKGLVEKLIVRVVERRRAENLLPMLVDLVQQDGVLTTDCWRAYGGFAAEATKKAEGELQKLSARRETATPANAESRPASPRPDQEAQPAAAAAAAADPAAGSRPGSPTHRTVNHARHFKDPETDAHSNHIEGMWAVLKNELRRRFGRVGFTDMEMMNDRLQLAVWLCNTRLAFQRDKANGLNTVRAFFAMVFAEPVQELFPTQRVDADDDELVDPVHGETILAFDDDGVEYASESEPGTDGDDEGDAGDD